MEQPPENPYIGVRQPAGKRHPGRLYAGRRGTVLEGAQSRVVRVQPVLGSFIKPASRKTSNLNFKGYQIPRTEVDARLYVSR